MEKAHMEIRIGQDGHTALIANFWYEDRKGREFSSFQYSDEWLESPISFALTPSLPLDAEKRYFQGDNPFPLAVNDAMPDSWGQKVLQQFHRHGKEWKKLNKLLFLLGFPDSIRMGALRFRLADDDGPFLAIDNPSTFLGFPDLAGISSFIRAADKGLEDLSAFRRFVDSSSSLGGAKPKCTFMDGDGRLCMAKFHSANDDLPMCRMEVATSKIAQICGIAVPESRVVEVEPNYPFSVFRRFDREGRLRIPFMSAQAMLGKPFGQDGTYVEIADAIRAHGANPKMDLAALFQRIVFTILTSNYDDHLRNHGFLYQGNNKWGLSPMYDVNPKPTRSKNLKTPIADLADPSASLEILLDHAFFFELGKDAAVVMVKGTAKSIKESWEFQIKSHGLGDTGISLYRPAFEHEESRFALRLNGIKIK